jgi:hypothetical protein
LEPQRDIAFADVLDEEFVGLAAGSALADHLAWQSARLGRSLKLRIRLRGLDAVCRMVECGVGDCRRARNRRRPLSENHGTRFTAAHG